MEPPQTEDIWGTENVVGYYQINRCRVDDLYESERYFLPDVLQADDSVLDIGCATGGFRSIFAAMEPTMSYTGIDSSPGMIGRARKLHPCDRFHVMNDGVLPFDKRRFDLVFCFGTMHLTLNWRDLIREGWRVAKKYFLFDVRLTHGKTIEDQNISYERLWNGKITVPYIIVNETEFHQFIDTLEPAPAVKKSYGYYHTVSPMTVTPDKEVYMNMVCLVKKSYSSYPRVRWGVMTK